MKTRTAVVAGFVFLTLWFTVALLPSQAGDDPIALFREEAGDREFKQYEVGGKLVFFHQRRIGDAIVEKDFLLYHFDKRTLGLLLKKSHWRQDLPESFPVMPLTKEQAERKVRGDVQFSQLYYISKDSDVFPLDPVPHNPCWVVRSVDGPEIIVTIIDAVTGRRLGNGVPPPYSALSFAGPWAADPCLWTWARWFNSAKMWFETMGYPTQAEKWPTRSLIQSHVQSYETALIYELAHGDSRSFSGGCYEGTYYESTSYQDIETWIQGYPKLLFTFLGSCDGMCYVDAFSLSYAARKGSEENTATVGYCGMSTQECGLCWTFSVAWQEVLFAHMNQGLSVKDAFDQANAAFPICLNANCMRFAGDPDFAIVPMVARDESKCIDNDGDGYYDAASPCTFPQKDCDDANLFINPGKIEGPPGEPDCEDGVDNDCDDKMDAEDPGCIECMDNDGDGYGDPASEHCAEPKQDCDDANPAANPGHTEVGGNAVDDDCDGTVDELCFVATAAFGTELEARIDVLRSFRDQYLLKTPMGKAFVDTYFEYGQPVADYISERDWLRVLVRTMLLPVIGLVSLFV